MNSRRVYRFTLRTVGTLSGAFEGDDAGGEMTAGELVTGILGRTTGEACGGGRGNDVVGGICLLQE